VQVWWLPWKAGRLDLLEQLIVLALGVERLPLFIVLPLLFLFVIFGVSDALGLLVTKLLWAHRRLA
jgi:hypothetical protein